MIKIRERIANKLQGIANQSTAATRRSEAAVLFQVKADSLTEKTLNSTSPGISGDDICRGQELIVSLTTYGKRLYDAYLPIESIMQGSIKPNRIILWLAEDLRNKELPITLKKQQGRGLEIKFCNDLRAYKKIIPTLRENPDACIVTIDDDAIYQFDLLENMVSAYNSDPNYIYANWLCRIVMGSDGKPIDYMKWPYCSNDVEASHLNFSIGIGGVLYPPGSLAQEVLNESVFMDICNSNDDVWLNAMALLNGTKKKKVITRQLWHNFIDNIYVQDVALKIVNANMMTGECLNNKLIADVYSRYGLFDKLV